MDNIIKANALKERGFPYSTIRQFCHMKGSPFFQKREGGTWWVDEKKLDKFLDKLAERKEVYG